MTSLSHVGELGVKTANYLRRVVRPTRLFQHNSRTNVIKECRTIKIRTKNEQIALGQRRRHCQGLGPGASETVTSLSVHTAPACGQAGFFRIEANLVTCQTDSLPLSR